MEKNGQTKKRLRIRIREIKAKRTKRTKLGEKRIQECNLGQRECSHSSRNEFWIHCGSHLGD